MRVPMIMRTPSVAFHGALTSVWEVLLLAAIFTDQRVVVGVGCLLGTCCSSWLFYAAAHPDVVDTALAAFDAVLGERPNQIDKQRYDVDVSPEQLLDAGSTPGEITEEGLRSDVSARDVMFAVGGVAMVTDSLRSALRKPGGDETREPEVLDKLDAVIKTCSELAL